MKERRPSRHHILRRWMGKHFNLPTEYVENPTNYEYLSRKEHRKRHVHESEDMALIKTLMPADKKYTVRIIPREEILIFKRGEVK